MKNSSKIEAVIYYICKKCKDNGYSLFTTKLAKLLWFSDTHYFEQYGKSITSITEYQKYNFGPFLPDFYNSLTKLENDGYIKSYPEYKGKKYTVVDNKKFTGIKLTPPEKKTIDENIEAYGAYTSKQISETSHEDWWDFL